MVSATAACRADLPVAGMDCADYMAHVEHALRTLPGVGEVRASLVAERASVRYDPALVTMERLHAAIAEAGYRVSEGQGVEQGDAQPARDLGQVVGWRALGLLDRALERLPWWIPAAAILLGGWQLLLDVLRDARHARITSHTLMTVGAIAAVTVGQWATAVLIVFFMCFSGWIEAQTSARNRRALQQLVAFQPATARLLRDGDEIAVPVAQVAAGDLVAVRPGERIPADGQVLEGEAPVDEASITGESAPVDKGVGDPVFAATVAQAGFLKVRATEVGRDTTFGRIVRLMEEAEAQKAPVQQLADRFSTYYLPVVLLTAVATFLLTHRVLNAVAVLVVVCAIVIATPVVVLASVATAARRGVLIKGGLVLE